ncbi:MAG: hypothetical protein E7A86_00045 [Bradyrhizobium sp.]|nr:hypothetical protein [Bradyrhizobium sp.]MDU6372544.1 hypothetical protein [Bradyrhizobium sp.]
MPRIKPMTDFVKAGETIREYSPCFKKRGVDQNNLVPGAVFVDGALCVEFVGRD